MDEQMQLDQELYGFSAEDAEGRRIPPYELDRSLPNLDVRRPRAWVDEQEVTIVPSQLEIDVPQVDGADPNDDLIGLEFTWAGVPWRVTGTPRWSPMYVAIEANDGTSRRSVRNASLLRATADSRRLSYDPPVLTSTGRKEAEMRLARSLRVLDRAIEANEPTGVYAMFSGGHDSLTATAVTAKHPAFTAAVHINTGVGIEQTRQFVRDVCADRGWPLIEVGPPENLTGYDNVKTYEDIVLDKGFPGPAQHPAMYNRLKERSIRWFVRDHKERVGGIPLFSTGIRLDESVRRFKNYAEPAAAGWVRDGGKVWASPIQDYSKAQCHDLMELLELPRNEVVDLIHMSGECLCGAYAKPGEMEELEMWFPETAAYLHDLERRAEEQGRIGCVWGHRPDNVNAEQLRLMPILPLCTSCTFTRSPLAEPNSSAQS